MSTRAEDLQLLRALRDSEKLSEDQEVIFGGMLERLESAPMAVLSEKQREWAKDVAEKLEIISQTENLFSAGKVPLGRPVLTPEVLKNLPLKPPGRK